MGGTIGIQSGFGPFIWLGAICTCDGHKPLYIVWGAAVRRGSCEPATISWRALLFRLFPGCFAVALRERTHAVRPQRQLLQFLHLFPPMRIDLYISRHSPGPNCNSVFHYAARRCRQPAGALHALRYTWPRPRPLPCRFSAKCYTRFRSGGAPSTGVPLFICLSSSCSICPSR